MTVFLACGGPIRRSMFHGPDGSITVGLPGLGRRVGGDVSTELSVRARAAKCGTGPSTADSARRRRLWQGNQRRASEAIACLAYIASNARSLINYGERFRSGERISSRLAESTINAVVSNRFAKRQPMPWTKRGAHLLLRTRIPPCMKRSDHYSNDGPGPAHDTGFG